MRPENDYNTSSNANIRQRIRITFVVIIFIALPFYPIGIFLWASAPDDTAVDDVPTEATLEPIDEDDTETPTRTRTPRPTRTPVGDLDPTPIQVFPPAQPTSSLPTQPVDIPTSTNAPTLTAVPTFTPLPTFTNTPLPQPTATDPPTATLLPPPTDTPLPQPTATNPPPPTDHQPTPADRSASG
jgi:hypothetical protein